MSSGARPLRRARPALDGGAFDWLHTLAANRKLVLAASAIDRSSPRIFRADAAQGA